MTEAPAPDRGPATTSTRLASLAEVQAVTTADLEAVDLAPVRRRAGFSADSARVPPP
ncbi:MAG: hypothetical protein IPO09_22070 [Anaeromyxobacter sp.]|nr:hypothetical protein [Anaeromyxobacter sp.]MBL0274549.1 hypothetical protein [Anaeromyxobacter sp.]